jgi:hypothetical protein
MREQRYTLILLKLLAIIAQWNFVRPYVCKTNHILTGADNGIDH